MSFGKPDLTSGMPELSFGIPQLGFGKPEVGSEMPGMDFGMPKPKVVQYAILSVLACHSAKAANASVRSNGFMGILRREMGRATSR